MFLYLIKRSNGFHCPARQRQTARRTTIAIVTSLVVVLSHGCTMFKTNEKTETPPPSESNQLRPDDALAIHRRAIAIDLHADSIQRAVDEGLDLGQLLPDGHL